MMMMTAYQTLEVENFKGIRHMKLEGLGMVNVFVGKNNVTKTSLLDSITVAINSFNIGTLEEKTFPKKGLPGCLVLGDRYYVPTYYSPADFSLGIFGDAKLIKNMDLPRKIANNQWLDGYINLNSHEIFCSFETSSSIVNNSKTTFFESTKGKEKRYFEVANFPDRSIPKSEKIVFRNYISTNPNYIKNLCLDYFESIRFKSKEYNEILKTLRVFEPRLKDILYGTDNKLQAIYETLDHTNSYDLPIDLMGEGTIKLIGLASIMQAIKGEFLLVDEIENGFHYSVQKDMWRMVLQAAKDPGTQFFFTTHSADILKSLAEVIQEDAFKDYKPPTENDLACIFHLEKDETDEVKAARFPKEEFTFAIERALELR